MRSRMSRDVVLALEETLYGYIAAWEACNPQGMLLYVTDFVIWILDTDSTENVREVTLEGYEELEEELIAACSSSVPYESYPEITQLDISHSGFTGATNFGWLTENAWTDETRRFQCVVSSGTTNWRLELQTDGRWLITDRSHSQQELRQSCRTLTPSSLQGQEVAMTGDQTSSSQASSESSQVVALNYAGDLASLLPSSGEVPGHMVFAGEQNRSLDEVAANYTDPAEITAIFSGWGWQGNVTRAFAMPSGVYPEQQQINGVYVSIHAFGSPQDAVAALDYSMMDQAASTGGFEVSMTPLGDYSRALLGEESYGNEITLLVQRSNLLIRLSASQLEGDASGFAVGVMQGILTRTG